MPKNTQYKNESKQDFNKRQNSQKVQEGLSKFGQKEDPFVGLNSTQIANYQRFLKEYGYYEGKIDSLAGPMTREAHFKYKDKQSMPQESEGMRGAGYFGKDKEGNPKRPVRNMIDSIMDYLQKK
jgi:hypothetical protein